MSVGRWRLIRKIGKGGHADVWLAEGKDGQPAALKVLRGLEPRSRTYRRFRDEVELMRRLGDLPGVLPLLDASVPEKPSRSNPAWLAMPLATGLREHFGDQADLRAVVGAIAEVAETLAELGSTHGVYHRDIKPANLYVVAGAALVGDFGLAAFPDSAGLTRPHDKVGPIGFLAPEMLEVSGETDPGPADVYALAKTLWVLATGSRWPPQGEILVTDEDFRLGSRTGQARAQLLESLLAQATKNRPTDRPTMRDFAAELRRWLAPPSATRIAESNDEDLRRRIGAIQDPERARRQQIQSTQRAINDTLGVMRDHLGSINETLSKYGLDTTFNSSEVMFQELGLGTEPAHYRTGWEARGFADSSRNDGRGPLEFIAVAGIEDLGSGRIRLLAAHAIGENHMGRRVVWSDDATVLPKTAGEADALARLGSALAKNLPPSLTLFAERLEARYPPPILRDSLAAATGPDGLFYVLGGQLQFDGGALAVVETFDPSLAQWADAPPMPTARMQLTATTLNGRIFALGGHTHAGHVDAVEAFDPVTQAWNDMASLPNAVSECACAAAGDLLIACGGYGDVDMRSEEVLAYDSRQDRWDVIGHLVVPCRGHAFVASADGLFYMIGGWHTRRSESPWTAAVSAFDVKTCTWESRAPLPTPRAFLAAAAGRDGRIYAAGGFNGDGEVDLIEVYNPDTDEWVKHGHMKATRAYFAASTGPDGDVLFVGGKVSEVDMAEIIEIDPVLEASNDADPPV